MTSNTVLNTTEFTSYDFGEWCQVISKAYVPLMVSSRGKNYFRGRLRSRNIADASLIELTSTPQTIERAEDLIAASDNPYYILSLQLAGTGMMIQDGREALLGPGDMAIFDTNRAYTRIYETNFRSLVFRLPQRFMDLPPESIGQLTATRFAVDSGPNSVISPFLASMANNLDALNGLTGQRLIRNAADIIATMLYGELGHRSTSVQQGTKGLLLRDIDLFIETHLSDPTLHPQLIADAHFISLRNLHGLFHGRGVSVSTWIRTRRLDLCQRDLTDPILFHLPVGSIAARHGLTDHAHFSRLFKRAYGMSPSEYRLSHTQG